MNHAVVCTVGVAAILGIASSSSAGLLGNTIDAQWRFPEFDMAIETHLVEVTSGLELPADAILSDERFSIDIGDDFVLFEFTGAILFAELDFNGWWFHDINDTVVDIVSYTIDSTSAGVTGLDPSDLGNDINAVWADFGGVSIAGPNEWIKLKVNLIPAPTALPLLAIACIAARTRRRGN